MEWCPWEDTPSRGPPDVPISSLLWSQWCRSHRRQWSGTRTERVIRHLRNLSFSHCIWTMLGLSFKKSVNFSSPKDTSDVTRLQMKRFLIDKQKKMSEVKYCFDFKLCVNSCVKCITFRRYETWLHHSDCTIYKLFVMLVYGRSFWRFSLRITCASFHRRCLICRKQRLYNCNNSRPRSTDLPGRHTVIAGASRNTTRAHDVSLICKHL